MGASAQSVAQSLDAADNINRELVQLTMRGFQRYFEATMQLDEATGELRRVTMAVRGLMAVAVVLLAVGLFLMLRRGVSRPLQHLTQAITLPEREALAAPGAHAPARLR